MNAHDDLELRLRAWMTSTAPDREPPGVVDRALAVTGRSRQRSNVVATGLGRSWPSRLTLSPTVRAVLVALAVLAALAASAYVGSQLLRSRQTLPTVVEPPPGQPWTRTGSTVTDHRDAHSATLLKDGRVLIVGGLDDQGPLGSAEIWDPATGRFTATGRMAVARGFHTATLLRDGRVLIAGGTGVGRLNARGGVMDMVALASAELYDPTTGEFTPTGSMRSARGLLLGGSLHPLAELLDDGRVFITGGSDSNRAAIDADIYDPTTGTFRTTSMLFCDDPRTVTRLLDGRLLVTCLQSTHPARVENPMKAAFLYDPRTDSFSATGDPTNADDPESAAVLDDGRVVLVGRRSSPDLKVDLYDPTTGTFSMVRTSPTGGKAVTLADGRVLVVGSGDGQIFDPATGRVLHARGPSGSESGMTATRLLDGRVLVVVDDPRTGVATDDHRAFLFDPAALP